MWPAEQSVIRRGENGTGVEMGKEKEGNEFSLQYRPFVRLVAGPFRDQGVRRR